MERRSILDLTPLRVGVALVAIVISLAVLAFVLRPSGGVVDDTAQSPAPPETTAVVGDTEAVATPTATTGTTPDDAATPTPTEGTPAAVATSTPASVNATASPGTPSRSDVRLQIPAIDVDAWVIRMGLDEDGVMEVPYDGQLVAWYDFTAVPGAPGNAVMSAHLDYRGSTAVFWRLADLEDGDRVTVLIEGEPIEYVVSRVYLTRPEDANLREILGGRSGPETLTLITCGGVWDSAEGEYDHRVIVQATRVV